VIRTVEEAARRANGFIFVPGSKRVMSVDDVNRIASLLNERLLPNQKSPSLPLDETEGMEMEMWMEIAPWFTTDAQSIDCELSRGRSRPLLVGKFENTTVEVV
jgi:hypothetical protein